MSIIIVIYLFVIIYLFTATWIYKPRYGLDIRGVSSVAYPHTCLQHIVHAGQRSHTCQRPAICNHYLLACPREPPLIPQRQWDEPLCHMVLQNLIATFSVPVERLLAVSEPEIGSMYGFKRYRLPVSGLFWTNVHYHWRWDFTWGSASLFRKAVSSSIR